MTNRQTGGRGAGLAGNPNVAGNMAKFDRLAAAGVDRAQVGGGQVLSADDVRHQHEDDFVVGDGVILGTEQIFEQRNGAQARNAAPAYIILLLEDAAQNADLALGAGG